MEPIRLIAMDMDGTLLTSHPRVIPSENIEALRRAADAGIHLAIASGRLPDDAGFFALDAELPMHIIALNGSAVMEKPLGQIMERHYIDSQTALRILEMLEERQFMYSLFSDHDVVHCHSQSDVIPLLGTHLLRQGSRTRLEREVSQAYARHDRVSKFVVTCADDAERIQSLRRRLEAQEPLVEVSSSWVDNIEINPLGVNKGSALTALAASLGIPMSQVMAIGDNDNDIPMLRAAGYGVAMGNATPAAREAANWLTLPCQEYGVAAAIRALALGESVPGVERLA